MKNIFEKNGKKRNKISAIFWRNGNNVSNLYFYTTKTYYEKRKQKNPPLRILSRFFSMRSIDGKDDNSSPSQTSRWVREPHIGKIKRVSKKNSTENLHLQKNKNQTAKQANLGVKKLAHSKFTKVKNLQADKKKLNLQIKGSIEKKPIHNYPQVNSWLASRKHFADPANNRLKVSLKKELTKGEAFSRAANLSAKASLDKELTKDNYLPQLYDWLFIRKKSVDQVNFLVTASAGKKFTKNKHISQVDGWLANQNKSAKQVNLRVKKSAHKNFPKGKYFQGNKKEYILKGEGLRHKSLTNGQTFPQLHFWLTTGEPLADQGNLVVGRLLEKKLPKSQPLQGDKKKYHFLVKRLAEKELPKASPFKGNKKESSFLVKGSADKNSTKSFDIDQEADPCKFCVRFTNLLMLDGKKSKALSTLSKSLKLFKKSVQDLSCNEQFMQNSVKTKTNKSPLDYLRQAVANVKPCLEVRKKKISGIMRQIPAVPSLRRQETLGIRWIIESARKKKKNYKPFYQCLAEELVNAFQKQGEAYKRKQALHRTAEANRIYIRHRWW